MTQTSFDDLPVHPFPDGHVGPSPEQTIREAFIRFQRENPHIERELVRMCREARASGANRIGIGMLFEVMRWNHVLATGGDDFKLNNNYRSYYARLIMHRYPDLKDIFELRKLHGRGLGDGDLMEGGTSNDIRSAVLASEL